MNKRKYEVKEFERYRKQHEMREAAKMLDAAIRFLMVFIIVYLLAFMQTIR